MQKQRKTPLRKCVVMNEQYPKMEMFRIVRSPEGIVLIDLGGKAKGRGAYISKTKNAIMQAKKKKVLDRHLETLVPDEIYEQLLALLGEHIEKK